MSMRYPKGTKDRKFNFKNQKVEQKNCWQNIQAITDGAGFANSGGSDALLSSDCIVMLGHYVTSLLLGMVYYMYICCRMCSQMPVSTQVC